MFFFSPKRPLEIDLECPFPVSSFSLLPLLRFPPHHPGPPLLISSAAHQILLPPASSGHSTSPEAATAPNPPGQAPLSMQRPIPTLLPPPTGILAMMREPAGPRGGSGPIYRSEGEKTLHDDLGRRSTKVEMWCLSGICRRWVSRHGIEPREQI